MRCNEVRKQGRKQKKEYQGGILTENRSDIKTEKDGLKNNEECIENERQ